MDISVRKYGTVHVIELRGDLKIGESVDGFRQAIEQLFDADESQIVVDVGAVPMIDSSGIGVLVRSLTSAKQRGGGLKLVNPSKLALQTLKIVGLINLFEVFNDQAQAVESFA